MRTNAPRWLFDLTVRGAFAFEPVETDTGIVQIDSLRLDERASVRRAQEFMSSFATRVAGEAAALGRIGADLVIADIPPLGIAAAARAGVRAVAFGNFTWDWIYSAYDGTEDLVTAIARAYTRADAALRLPMWGGFAAFGEIIDVPYVARHASRDPQEVRRALGVAADVPLILTSFGGHGLRGLETAVRQLTGYIVLFTGLPADAAGGNVVALDEKTLYGAGFRYEDIVRAADVVVTKPGYGIIAECIANDTALLYTDRGHFIEYDVLVAAMPRVVRAAYIDHNHLFRGCWQPQLEALLAMPRPPERPRTDGAEVTAELVAGMMDPL